MMNVAVVGIGNMGKHHARIYSELPNTELVAVCDLNKNLGKELADKYGCKFYEDYHDMIKNEKLGAVSIAVPTSHHKKIAVDFLNQKIPVLLEKPICNNLDDAEEIIKTARQNSVTLLIGHIERYNPAIVKVKELIKEGFFGDVISIDAKRVGSYPSQIKDSDVILDVAIHDIDIINFLYESFPNEVFANNGNAFGGKKADYVDILMEYGNKSGSIQCNWVTPVKIRNLTVTGTKGYAELNYMTQELKLFESEVIKTFDDFGDFIIKFGNPTTTKAAIQKEEPLKIELTNFINSIENGEELKIDPDEAKKALEIVLKISHKGGENA